MILKSLLTIALIITVLPAAIYADVLSSGPTNTSAVMRDISRQSSALTGSALQTLDRYNQPVPRYWTPYYNVYGYDDPVSRAITRVDNLRREINRTIGNVRQDTNNLLNK